MGIRIPSGTTEVGLTSNVPVNAAFTYMVDYLIVSNAGASVPLIGALDAGLTDGWIAYWSGSSGFTTQSWLDVYDASTVVSDTAFPSQPAVGVPFVLYARCSGTGAGLFEVGWRYLWMPTWVKQTATLSATVLNSAKIYLGGIAVLGAGCDKTLQNVKVWDRALSDSELLEESRFEAVRFPTKLNRYYPLPDIGDLYDRGPLKRNITVAGGATSGYFTLRRGNPAPRLLRIKKPAVAYTLTASGGSYAITGTATGLLRTSILSAGSGSYVITGTAAALKHGYPLTATAGSYAITGTAATLQATRLISAVAGSYTITGTAAALKRGYPLTATAGSYAVTGTAATLKVGRYLSAVAGNYVITGTATTLKYGHLLSATAGSYTISGTAAALKVGRYLGATAGSYTISGTAATLTYAPSSNTYTLTAASGSYVITGTAAALRATRVISAGSGAIVFTGTTALTLYGRLLSAGSGSYAITGTAATLSRTRRLTSDSGSYVVTGTDADLRYSSARLAGTCTLTLTATGSLTEPYVWDTRQGMAGHNRIRPLKHRVPDEVFAREAQDIQDIIQVVMTLWP